MLSLCLVLKLQIMKFIKNDGHTFLFKIQYSQNIFQNLLET